MDKVRRLGRNASVEASSEQGPKELLLAHSHAQAMPNTGSEAGLLRRKVRVAHAPPHSQTWPTLTGSDRSDQRAQAQHRIYGSIKQSVFHHETKNVLSRQSWRRMNG